MYGKQVSPEWMNLKVQLPAGVRKTIYQSGRLCMINKTVYIRLAYLYSLLYLRFSMFHAF